MSHQTRVIEKIRNSVESLYPEIVDIRRDIHRHPELSMQEFRTTALVREYLLGLGLKIEHDFLETGVVALLEGGGGTGDKGLVGLRADIDALPLEEAITHDFCSVEKGVMHACGHDMHTAIVLGTAKVLSGMKDELSGDVLFVFQPSEEKAPGGAKPLIDAGLFEAYHPSAFFGIHCFPYLETGKVAIREGSLMAAADELYIKVHGEGGHASSPHKTADPILAAAHIITALQHLVSRVASPYEPAVVSISSISGGNATNIIPGTVSMSGTLRTLNEALRDKMHERLIQTIQHTARGLGVEAELDIVHGYPVLYNDPLTTRAVHSAALAYLGDTGVRECELLMTAEDFAYYLQHCPGTFILLGTSRGNEERGDTLHSPRFDPDERAILTGMGVMSYAAQNWLGRS